VGDVPYLSVREKEASDCPNQGLLNICAPLLALFSEPLLSELMFPCEFSQGDVHEGVLFGVIKKIL
jgi:hypothetical protein